MTMHPSWDHKGHRLKLTVGTRGWRCPAWSPVVPRRPGH